MVLAERATGAPGARQAVRASARVEHAARWWIRRGVRAERVTGAPEARQAERAAAQARRTRWQTAETWGRARSTLPEGGVSGLARSARQRAERSD